jgi:hypothetical protein
MGAVGGEQMHAAACVWSDRLQAFACIGMFQWQGKQYVMKLMEGRMQCVVRWVHEHAR